MVVHEGNPFAGMNGNDSYQVIEDLWDLFRNGSNGSGPIDNVDDTDTDYGHTILLSDILGIWITGIFCIVGLVGNIVSFLVLSKAHGHSPMFFVLRAVAISDAVFLLSVFILQTLVNIYHWTGVCHWCFSYRGYIQFSIWPILMMTQMTTVWLTVLVSLERYVAICFPLNSATICTMSKVRKAVIIIYVASVLYNIPRYFEFKVVESQDIDKTKVGSHEVYRYLYTGVLYSLMLFFIPLLMLIFLNFKLVMALKEGKKQWETLQFRQKKEQNLTIIPLTIVLVFFIGGVPALAVNVIDSMNPFLWERPSYVVFMVIANLLVVLNSACNFIIYCLLGKKFRSKLIEMCHCKCAKYRQVLTTNNTQLSDF